MVAGYSVAGGRIFVITPGEGVAWAGPAVEAFHDVKSGPSDVKVLVVYGVRKSEPLASPAKQLKQI